MSEISLKFGFWGIGMGGTSIANECAAIRLNVKNNMNPYTALLINTNQVDLDKLPNLANAHKYMLRGYEKGAGRDIRIGEEAFLKYKEEISKKVQNFFGDRDFVFIVCGLGGGTGTGAIIEAARMLHTNGFKGKFGLILTLPRDQEGRLVLDNAIQRLQMIVKIMKGLGSVLLVDNQLLFSDYLEKTPSGSVQDFLAYSNKYIANILHDLNVATANYHPTGAYHFDSSELFKMLQTPGVISLGKVTEDPKKIDADNLGSYMPKFKHAVENGVLSTGYNLEDSTRCAVSLIAPTAAAQRIFTVSMLDTIEQQLIQYTPYADERPVATYKDESVRDLKMYAVFAGLSLPKRISEIVQTAKSMERKERQTDNALELLQGYSSSAEGAAASEEADFDALLAEDQSPKRLPSDDPFSLLANP